MIPQFVMRSLEEQPPDTEFRYENSLFGKEMISDDSESFDQVKTPHSCRVEIPNRIILTDIYGRVFGAKAPAEDTVAIYEVALEAHGVAGFLVRSQEHNGKFCP